MKEILELHESAANSALNAHASHVQLRLCLAGGYAYDALAWAELYDNDLKIAEHISAKAARLEAKHGSVFPGVSP